MSTMIINGIQPSTPTGEVEETSETSGKSGAKGATSGAETPPVKGSTDFQATDLPVLVAPNGGLSLESLMSALGNDSRKQACKEGVDSLEVKAQQQKEINDKQLEKLKEQLEVMAEQEKLSIFMKIFKFIGMIVGAIAAVASVTAGIITGNPLLVAAGVAGAIMVLDSTLAMCSDGKYSIMAGFAELGKVCGMSDEDAQIFAMAMQLVLTVVVVALSIGAAGSGAANSANVTAEISEKAFNAILTGQKIMNIASGVVTAEQGLGTIATTMADYDVNQITIANKELDAILERLRQSIEMDKALVEAEMKRNNDLMGMLSDIVKNCNEAQTAILGNVPSMA